LCNAKLRIAFALDAVIWGIKYSDAASRRGVANDADQNRLLIANPV
jgi:hypothetical protein